MKIYLVGGAVRDILLGKNIRDFDFSVEGLVRPIGKHIADELGGAYYVLDDERDMVRVIIDDENMGQFDVDISLLTGDSIEDDLRERDFTFNAMAIELGPHPCLIDPLGGYEALQNRILHMCGPDSLSNDPMRALRAVRMGLEFEMQMDDELLTAMQSVTDQLKYSSMERYRDELFKIIRLKKNEKALLLCEKFGFLQHLFPGFRPIDQEKGLEFVRFSDYFTKLLTEQNADVQTDDEFSKFAASRLGNYRGAMQGFFDKPLALYHTRRMLADYASIAEMLAAENSDTVKKWCSRLTFSSSETNFVLFTLQAFSRLNGLTDFTGYTDVDIYRYFRKYKEGGIGGLILYLAEKYRYQEKPDAYKHWCECVVLAQDLLTAYFSRYMEVIDPKPLLSGNDIQDLIRMPAGPLIGQIKNSLIEAQIRGSVQTVREAESFVIQLVKNR